MHARKLDLLPHTARETVRSVFNAAVGTLSADDRSLPAIAKMLPMLERGVALHHSGMLPVLREVVEILFQENLVKLLFATEAFAMGPWYSLRPTTGACCLTTASATISITFSTRRCASLSSCASPVCSPRA